jgi:hypothetical protein
MACEKCSPIFKGERGGSVTRLQKGDIICLDQEAGTLRFCRGIQPLYLADDKGGCDDAVSFGIKLPSISLMLVARLMAASAGLSLRYFSGTGYDGAYEFC